MHSLVDDHSRLAYSEILADEKGATCATFLKRAATYLTARGITRDERVMTDNAFADRHSNDMQRVYADVDAQQKFIKSQCPRRNGKAERLNRTLATEWVYQPVPHQ